MKNESLFVLIIVAFISSLLTWVGTFNITNARWETDCKKIGKTVTNGKVYECSLKEATK